MRRYLGFLILLSLTCSCQNKTSNNNSIVGTWESFGNGWLLEIPDSTSYSFYDITSIPCLPSRKGNLEELVESISLRNDTLSLLKGVITYQFTRAQQLPTLSTTPLDAIKANNPIYNFEVFAETLKEHYAFMEFNNIDWNKRYTAQKGKLNKQSTDAELYLVLEETLELLNDNHAFLEATEEVDEAVDQILNKKEIDADNDTPSLPEYGDFQVADRTARHHLQEDMTEDS